MVSVAAVVVCAHLHLALLLGKQMKNCCCTRRQWAAQQCCTAAGPRAGTGHHPCHLARAQRAFSEPSACSIFTKRDTKGQCMIGSSVYLSLSLDMSMWSGAVNWNGRGAAVEVAIEPGDVECLPVFCFAPVWISREWACDCDSELLLLLFCLVNGVADMQWGCLVGATLDDPIQIRLNTS